MANPAQSATVGAPAQIQGLWGLRYSSEPPRGGAHIAFCAMCVIKAGGPSPALRCPPGNRSGSSTTASVNYTYDGDGKRVMNSAGTYYWTMASGNQLSDTPGAGAGNEYIFFAGQRIAWVDSSGTVRYYWGDHLGTTRIVTDAAGNVCYDADFYPFQGERAPYVSNCTPAYKFAGMKFDQESGNYYTLNRSYPPNLGRWMSPDPLGGDISNPQSLNRYAYVLNNPVNFIDPLGLQCSNVFNGSWEGSGYPPCGDASTHTSQPAESPTSIAGPVGVAVGSMIGYVSPEMAWGEAAYAARVQTVWDSLYLTARMQQGALTPEEAKAFVSLHPELLLTFGVLASADVWSFKYGELTNSIFELLGWKIEENPLALAGMYASPVADPRGIALWYGASVAAVGLVAGGQVVIGGLETFAMTNPTQWMWMMNFGNAALLGGAPATWPAVAARAARTAWSWWTH